MISLLVFYLFVLASGLMWVRTSAVFEMTNTNAAALHWKHNIMINAKKRKVGSSFYFSIDLQIWNFWMSIYWMFTYKYIWIQSCLLQSGIMLRCFGLLETLGNTGRLIKASGPLCWTTILQKHIRSYIYRFFSKLWHTYCIKCLGRFSQARSELTVMQSSITISHAELKCKQLTRSGASRHPGGFCGKVQFSGGTDWVCVVRGPYFQTENENWEKTESCTHVRRRLRPPRCEFLIYRGTANQAW